MESVVVVLVMLLCPASMPGMAGMGWLATRRQSKAEQPSSALHQRALVESGDNS